MVERAIALVGRIPLWQRLLLAAGIATAVGALMLLLVFSRSGESFALLFADVSEEDQRQISNYLDANAIAYEIENGAISVPETEVARIRLALAEQGIPQDASIGYEIFDRDQGFGTSNFVQEVNQLRALEGELARTINQIDSIARARVHLVLPRRELFSRDQQPPSASIIVTPIGQGLGANQILAIRNLVASAIPDLEPTDVSIVDSGGNLLARAAAEGDVLFGETPAQIRGEYETRLAGELETLISQVVGFGNVRVRVQADMDFDQTVIREERIDPEQQVLLSSEFITENTRRVDNRNDVVTIENNLPEGAVDNNQPQLQDVETIDRLEERQNFEIGSVKTDRVVAPGRIERLSVAVLVDGTQMLNDDGIQMYVPRSPEEMREIERLVKSAIGFSPTERADVVEIVNLQFFDDTELTPPVPEEPEQMIFGIPISLLTKVIELLVLALVVTIISLVVVRPLMRNIFGTQTKVTEQPETPLLTDREKALAAIQDRVGKDALKSPKTDLIESPTAVLFDRVHKIFDAQPEASANIVRSWIHE